MVTRRKVFLIGLCNPSIMDTTTQKRARSFFLRKNIFFQKKQKTRGHGGHGGHKHLKERYSMYYKILNVNFVSTTVRSCPPVSTCPRVHHQNQVFGKNFSIFLNQIFKKWK